MSDVSNVVKKFINMGEERMAEVMDQLMSNDKVSAVLAKAMARTQTLKASLDKNVSLAFTLLNQPTREDFDKLRKKLRNMEREFEDLTAKVDDVAKQMAAKKQPRTKAEQQEQ